MALFKFFEYFPFSKGLSLLGLLLVITFFVSSSDSGSLVIDTLASGGLEEPPVWQRIFWALTEGVVAAVLILAGGLEALQTMTIISAFPMIFVILIGIIALIKSLREDHLLHQSVEYHQTTIQYSQVDTSWKDRLKVLITHPQEKEIQKFLIKLVRPAFLELELEMEKNGLDVEVTEEINHSLSLAVKNGDVEDFKYQVIARSFEVPDYAPEHKKSYFRADVFLLNGGQDYDIYGYTIKQIIADVITQYEKHSHYLHKSNAELSKKE